MSPAVARSRSRLLPLGAALLLGLMCLRPSGACPFCGWDEMRPPPIHEAVRRSDAAVLARPGTPVLEDGVLTFPFRVERVLRGVDIAVGQVVDSGDTETVRPSRLHLLTKEAGAWRVRAVSEEAAAFLADLLVLPDAPAGEPPSEDRLRFCLRHLHSRDDDVAEAAFFEFTRAPYASVKALARHIDPEELVRHLEEGRRQYNRGLLFLLLGISGGEEHRATLLEWLRSPAWRSAGYDGLLGAFLFLAGEEGLPLLVDRVVTAKERMDARSQAAALMVALLFHATEEDVLPDEDIRRAVRRTLDNGLVADLAVQTLERLEDWDALPDVAVAHRRHRDGNPWLHVFVCAYLRASPRPEAKAMLEKITEG